MNWMLFLVFGIITVAAFAKSEKWQKNKKIEAAFSGRPTLSPAEFYEQFFQTQGVSKEVVMGVRKVLEELLAADFSRLVASDDFSKNIDFFFEFDSMADLEIVCALEKEFSIKISDEEAANSHTIQDLVDLVWCKVQENI